MRAFSFDSEQGRFFMRLQVWFGSQERHLWVFGRGINPARWAFGLQKVEK